MKVLIIGGSGYVGKMLLPLMKERHQIRIFDLFPPADKTVEFVEGGVNDESALAKAMTGVDGVVYLAMGKDEKGQIDTVGPAYDVNVKGVHQACQAALNAGAKRLVYMSTLSVYADGGRRFCNEEEDRPDSPAVYGFTKALGEEVCRMFGRARGLNTISLRLNWPVEAGKWKEVYRQNPTSGATSGDDLARAVLAALDCKEPGFNAFFITGDFEGRKINMSKAKQILGWEPLARP